MRSHPSALAPTLELSALRAITCFKQVAALRLMSYSPLVPPRLRAAISSGRMTRRGRCSVRSVRRWGCVHRPQAEATAVEAAAVEATATAVEAASAAGLLASSVQMSWLVSTSDAATSAIWEPRSAASHSATSST